ncbi:hypothetical protein BGW42_008552 [Actinomortierella wolfii]|nr:hypothetical protein BGW42_008552 [Actinomortierella wolfii]
MDQVVCTDPKRNVKECNEKQCNQVYIDNYAVCQCRGNPSNFYKSSNNVEGLLRRCGLSTGKTFANPYGSPEQYRPGEGTRTFPLATRVFDGTTYVGGQTEVVNGITRIVGATPMVGMTRIVGGTTSWNGATPSIVGGTSTVMQAGPSPTAQPVVLPTPTTVPFTQQGRISGGAIAGIVLGLLAAAAIAFLLALCWRRKRKDPAYNQHLLAEPSRGPSRTVVTEKIEPVVVKAVPSNQVYTSGTGTDIGTGTGTGTITTTTTTSSVMAPQSGIVTAGGASKVHGDL